MRCYCRLLLSHSRCMSADLPGCLQSGTGYAELWPWRPEWWEPSWGHEEMPGEEEDQGQQQQQRKAA